MFTKHMRDAIVAALLSGNFEQVRYKLVEFNNDARCDSIVAHCCIAVAAVTVRPDRTSVLAFTYELDTENAGELAGFTHDQIRMLMNLNDTECRDFRFIAGVISTFPTVDEPILSPPTRTWQDELSYDGQGW